MVDSFVCAASISTVSVRVFEAGAFAAPQAATPPAVLALSRTDPLALAVAKSAVAPAGLPVVAMVQTLVLAVAPVAQKVKSLLWLTTTAGEMCAPCVGGKRPLRHLLLESQLMPLAE